MDLKTVKELLKIYSMELRCELTGWSESIPIDDVKKWLKRLDTRIIQRIKD